MNEIVKKHKHAHYLFLGHYRGVSAKLFASQLIIDNGFREVPDVDDLTTLRAVVAVIAIGPLLEDGRNFNTAEAYEYLGGSITPENNVYQQIMQDCTPIFQASSNDEVVLTRDECVKDLRDTTLTVLTWEKLAEILEKFAQNHKLTTFIPFAVEQHFYKNVDVDNIIGMFGHVYHIDWQKSKTQPAHYQIMVDSIIKCLDLEDNNLDLKIFEDISNKAGVDSPFAWNMKRNRNNGILEDFHSKSFIMSFCLFVSTFVKKI